MGDERTPGRRLWDRIAGSEVSDYSRYFTMANPAVQADFERVGAEVEAAEAARDSAEAKVKESLRVLDLRDSVTIPLVLAQRDRLAALLGRVIDQAPCIKIELDADIREALSVLDRETPNEQPAIDDALADLEAFIRAEQVGAWPWDKPLTICEGVLARVAKIRAGDTR